MKSQCVSVVEKTLIVVARLLNVSTRSARPAILLTMRDVVEASPSARLRLMEMPVSPALRTLTAMIPNSDNAPAVSVGSVTLRTTRVAATRSHSALRAHRGPSAQSVETMMTAMDPMVSACQAVVNAVN